MTFVGQVVPALGAGKATCPSRGRRWITTCPLRITDAPGRHRHVETSEFVLDLFGFSSASDAELVAVGHRFARNADLIELDAIATGSGVLVIRQPQQVTVVTDLAGVWPVFYAAIAGSLIYSSSAAAIAAQVGGEVDEQWLAARLLSGSVPETWSEGSPYRHVRAVPAGGVLLVGSSARPVMVRRELPMASVGFAEGAQRLARALITAVRGRMQVDHKMNMDLSGGLDSSTVVALAAAARPGSTLRAITVIVTELGGDDPAHARQVATVVPGLRHLELPLPREVDPYAALTEIPHTDEPFQDVSIFARLRWWMAAVSQLGSRGHLSGDGGDAVLLAPPAYLADLARCGTRGELRRHAADWARLRHRPAHRLVTLATRLARTTRAQALEDYARSLEHDSDSPIGPHRWEDLISWAPVPDCRHWFTRHARQLTATALRTTASTCASNGVASGDATSLAMIHAYGRAHRIHTALAAAQSVQLHAPYLDDSAVRADLTRGAAGLPIPLAALDQVLGTELWLRTLPTADDPAHHRERAHA